MISFVYQCREKSRTGESLQGRYPDTQWPRMINVKHYFPSGRMIVGDHSGNLFL